MQKSAQLFIIGLWS